MRDYVERRMSSCFRSNADYLKLMKHLNEQIARRVQKFFKKLQEANLPIPGSSTSKPSSNGHRQKKNFLKLEKPSTFFPKRNVPSDLLMREGSDDESELFTSRLQSTVFRRGN